MHWLEEISDHAEQILWVPELQTPRGLPERGLEMEEIGSFPEIQYTLKLGIYEEEKGPLSSTLFASGLLTAQFSPMRDFRT